MALLLLGLSMLPLFGSSLGNLLLGLLLLGLRPTLLIGGTILMPFLSCSTSSSSSSGLHKILRMSSLSAEPSGLPFSSGLSS